MNSAHQRKAGSSSGTNQAARRSAGGLPHELIKDSYKGEFVVVVLPITGRYLNMSSSTAVVILCGGVKTIAECTIYTLLKKCSDFSQR